jgi:hypothetical protein
VGFAVLEQRGADGDARVQIAIEAEVAHGWFWKVVFEEGRKLLRRWDADALSTNVLCLIFFTYDCRELASHALASQTGMRLRRNRPLRGWRKNRFPHPQAAVNAPFSSQ